MCYHENTLVIVLAASRSPADCKEDTKEEINWSLTNYLMSGSETVKCVTQTRNADHSPSKEKSCALPWQRSRYLVYVILFFFFLQFYYCFGTGLQVFAHNLASSLEITGDHHNSQVTKAITRFLIQHCQQPLDTTHHLVVEFTFFQDLWLQIQSLGLCDWGLAWLILADSNNNKTKAWVYLSWRKKNCFRFAMNGKHFFQFLSFPLFFKIKNK